MVPYPRILIAGANSGVGKTSLTLALVSALVHRGLKVQTYKVGPDYLDPTYLTIVSGRPCYNLDGWMMGEEYVRDLFLENSSDADISIIEGVMGLFDGADPDGMAGSSAEIAIWLDAAVLLVVNVHGLARSLAPIVKGFSEFHPDLEIAGTIANFSGSEKHGKWLSKALESSGLPGLVAIVPRGAAPELPSRYLGLVTADSEILDGEIQQVLLEVGNQYMDIDKIREIANLGAGADSRHRLDRRITYKDGSPLSPSHVDRNHESFRTTEPRVRIGIAKDRAFHFYYYDNIRALERAGAKMVPFSPIDDERLPNELDGLYLGGGYPEIYCRELSQNKSMLDSIRRFVDTGKPVYCECGGLMYLSLGIETLDNEAVEMVGVFPKWTQMLDRLQSLGYVEVELREDSLFGSTGSVLRGHEFHYSMLKEGEEAPEGWKSVYISRKRPGNVVGPQGYQKGNVLLSYAHMCFAPFPGAADRFIQVCARSW